MATINPNFEWILRLLVSCAVTFGCNIVYFRYIRKQDATVRVAVLQAQFDEFRKGKDDESKEFKQNFKELRENMIGLRTDQQKIRTEINCKGIRLASPVPRREA